MAERRFATGEVIYREGDRSDVACILISGQVEIVKDEAGGARRVETLGPGQVFGEIGLVLNQRRAVSAIAIEDTLLHVIDRWTFLNIVNERPEAARPLLKALVKHLAAAEKELARPIPALPTLAPAAHLSRLRLRPSAGLLEGLAAEGIELAQLPFRVGRQPIKGEHTPTEENDLGFADEKPFNLSRRHFAIEHTRRGLIVRDCGSHLGTLVNGVRIGAQADGNIALLKEGANEIVAGAETSPFRFTLLVEAD